MLRRLLTYFIAIVCLISCGCPRVITGHDQKDSVRIEYRERIVRDTVEYEMPVIVEKHITDDTLSVIENDYAKTTAVVHDGRLSHDLQTKPAVIKVPVAVPVHDTTYIERKAETITETVEVEKELTFFQMLFIALGKVMVVAIVAALLIGGWAIFSKHKLIR